MEYFLPIAQVEINILFIFGLSLAVGILSGLFGVGGGFLMTPFLIFLGIPPAYAVPNEASNILGTSVSGSTTHYLKGTLDYKMGLMIVVGGTIGTLLGILTFSYFQDIGKINIVISLAYMYILAILGTLMLIQGVSEIDKARKKIVVRKKLHTHYWIHGLPFRMRFKKSKVYESAFTPIIIGLIVGYIAAIMGVGGAFILVPAMIYIIGMGSCNDLYYWNANKTNSWHIFVCYNFCKCNCNCSSCFVQFGQKIGEKVDSSEFKTILAVLLLLVGIAIAYDTFIKEDVIVETVANGTKNLGNIAQFILDYSKDLPVFYGLTSVVLAVVLGIGAAILRNYISKWNKAREAKLKA